MTKTKKTLARERKAVWNLALAEGRIVQTNDGMTMTAYRTVEAAQAALAQNLNLGLDAKIVAPKEVV